MKTHYRLLISCSLLLSTLISFSQDNSPWRTVASQTVKGVYLSEGCHDYSLTGGQGFSVYIRNTGIQSVTVSGVLVARTVCGTDVTSPFTVNLTPGQISNGTDFDQNGNNGQTSVVKPTDCKGIRYAKLPYSKFINRIKTVRVDNLQIAPYGDSLSVAPAATNIVQATTQNIKTYVPANVPKVKFDSLGYYRQLYSHNQDSLSTVVGGLKTQNSSLLDSINALKMNTMKTTAIATPIVSVDKPVLPNLTILLQAGIGWDKLPLILNEDSLLPGQSMISKTSHPLLQIGGTFGFFNNSKVSLEVSPFFSYGFNMKSGETGTHYTYGGKVDLFFRIGHDSPLKVVVEGGYTGRNGTYSFTGTHLQTADYSYGLIHYGVGIRYTDYKNKFWLQPGIYWDANTTTPVFGPSPYMVANLEARILNKWQIGLSYGKDYFAQGTLKYPNNFYRYNQDYFGLRILYTFRVL